MGKAPAFMFYVKDWLSDPQLAMASHSTKGIWADMLCLMWDTPVKGEMKGPRLQMQLALRAKEADFDVFIEEASALLFCDISVTDNGIITVRNRRMWRDEKERKNNRERQSRYRDKRKPNEEITPPFPYPYPYAENKEEKEKAPDPPPLPPKVIPVRNIIPPPLELVREYCLTRKNEVNPEIWMAHYEAKGWRIGKEKMVDWQAGIRTWEAKKGGNGGNGSGSSRGERPIKAKTGRAESDGLPFPVDVICTE